MILRGLFILILSILSTETHAFNEVEVAKKLGLELASEGNPYNFLGINAIYTNEDLTRQMLVVSHVPEKLDAYRSFQQKGFLIVEIPKSDNSYVSMALIGIKEEEIKESIKTTSVWKKIIQEFNPLPRAYATECGITGLPRFDSIESIQRFFDSGFARGALQCMSSFLDGVWDSTGGRVQGAIEGIGRLIRDPQGFWDEKVQQMKNLGTFISQFDSKMREMARSLASLPAETKTMMICSFVGSLGTDLAMAIVTGGALAGNVMLRLNSYMGKIMRISRVLDVMKRAGNLTNMPPQFFRALSADRVPDKVLQNLNTFATHNMPAVITGAMSCAL